MSGRGDCERDQNARAAKAQSHCDAADRDSERMGFLVHELRNLVNTAIVAFEVLKKEM